MSKKINFVLNDQFKENFLCKKETKNTMSFLPKHPFLIDLGYLYITFKTNELRDNLYLYDLKNFSEISFVINENYNKEKFVAIIIKSNSSVYFSLNRSLILDEYDFEIIFENNEGTYGITINICKCKEENCCIKF